MNPDEPNLWEAMISDEKSYGYGWKAGKWAEQQRIIKLLEIGGPIEKIICEYWGNDDYDKDDALAMIELAIKGETK